MYVAHEAEGGGTGSARLRYARMSVEMALAECQLRSAQRQKKARAREEEREMHYTAAFRTTVPPPVPELFDLFEEPGGCGPTCCWSRRGRKNECCSTPWSTLMPSAHLCRFSMLLFRGWENSLVDILRFFDTLCPVAEQVIDVPKIILEDIPTRTPVRDPQLVEQLVEVPSLLFFLKQNVDIPVPGGGGRHGDLQGFLRGQSSTAPQFSEERISERIVEQIVDIPGGGLQGLRPVQGSTASSSSSVSRSPTDWLNTEDKAFQGFFALFPIQQKCEGHRALECESAPAVEFIHAERSSNGSG